MANAKQCPWCERWCLKDDACNYIFACGLETTRGFIIDYGCGRSWCWGCGKKFCSPYYDSKTGIKLSTARDYHDTECCRQDPAFSPETFCSGGCSLHCAPR